jgi:hypothetical protein
MIGDTQAHGRRNPETLMLIWRIEIYSYKDDKVPARVGYLSAATQDEAVSIAINAMGIDMRADIARTDTKAVDALPAGAVLWVSS